MKREEFLSRVRQAATQGSAYRVHVNPVDPSAGYVGAEEDLCDAFAAELKLIGGEPVVVDRWEDVPEVLRNWLRDSNARSAVCWQHEVLDKLNLREFLADEGIAWHEYAAIAKLPTDEQRQIVLAADVGITSTDFAVAETGTMVVCSAPGRERMFSLVPPVHIAIIERQQIVPDLLDVFARLQERGGDGLPSNIAFISGPSKTGDIELELTTGVHGPGKWYVVIVRGV